MTAIDLFFYAMACGFGMVVPFIVLAGIALLFIILVDKKVITPEYERKRKERDES